MLNNTKLIFFSRHEPIQLSTIKERLLLEKNITIVLIISETVRWHRIGNSRYWSSCWCNCYSHRFPGRLRIR